MQKFGIDVSKWQKGFDFDKALAEGVEFVILRGAYHTKKDTCFDTFYKQCKDRGIPVGVYHYTMAKNVAEAKREAEVMLGILAGKQFEYPVAFDVEEKSQADIIKAISKSKYSDKIQHPDRHASGSENPDRYSWLPETWFCPGKS